MRISGAQSAPITNHWELLDWFRFRCGRARQCWWSQSAMARDTGLRLRTLQRWITKLAEDGYLETIRRGRTSNAYNLLTKPVENSVDCGGTSGGTKRPHLITETTSLKHEQLPPRKPADKVRLPDILIENEYGGRVVNPQWIRARDILISAEERIRRARNPIAYQRAILRREGIA
jgi:hypothetical protein